MLRWRSDSSDNELRHSEYYYKIFLSNPNKYDVKSIIDKTIENYISDYIRLLDKIKVPTILLWFSEREPQYDISLDNISNLFGKFPHLINKETINKLSHNFDFYVQSVCNLGMPAVLKNRLSGKKEAVRRDRHLMKVNNYYPSQQMHMDAAMKLLPVVSEII